MNLNKSTTSQLPKSNVDLKVIILGNGLVGKTSLIHRYIHDSFSDTISTIGASFVLKKWHGFYFGIWDTAGQERFSRISNYYSRGAQAAILAYDITNKQSFEALRKYMDFLKEADKNCFIVVIGTKLDLILGEQTQREVSEEEGRTFALEYNAAFYETSSKTGHNVSAVFDTIGYHCLAERLASPALSSQEMTRISQSPSSGRFAALICATTLSVKYIKNQIKRTYESSRRDLDFDRKILDTFSKQASLVTNDVTLYVTKCTEMAQEQFNIGELISLLRNSSNLSHTEKLEAWSNVFNAALRRILFIISCFDLPIDKDYRIDDVELTRKLGFYKNFSSKIDMMYELSENQIDLVHNIFNNTNSHEINYQSDFCKDKQAELEKIMSKIFSPNDTSKESKYFFEAIPEFIKSITALQTKWCGEYKIYMRRLNIARIAITTCSE